MKASCSLVASVLAASTVALSSSSSSADRDVSFSSCSKQNSHLKQSEKFAPRFDGLRFIETLVTAHR
ncbi:hypothetical protein M9H77_25080 [Catharanthus roseus]|uniref:Uncharacterized protein n=1 Tax=Catharanthus roseus TaxID=4058 RepID=A0ACC0A751_CATRO|nr:hypothetical protein M9H77_25080 [Catharanthus roseus]